MDTSDSHKNLTRLGRPLSNWFITTWFFWSSNCRGLGCFD